MNREIKFRAWDAINQKMSESFGIREAYGDDDMMMLSEPKYQIMQYIGLKDKKQTPEYPDGQEIYGGDIVEQRNYFGELQGTYVCEWGQMGFTYTDPKRPDVVSHYISPQQLSVIGNIYESPNLLKE